MMRTLGVLYLGAGLFSLIPFAALRMFASMVVGVVVVMGVMIGFLCLWDAMFRP